MIDCNAEREDGADPPVSPLILVVDDYPDGREMTVDLLTVAGMRVVEAADGEQALDIARRALPDAIVLDLALPGINGWDVARSLKRETGTRSIPVVALTAHAMQEFRKRAMDAGCDGFLTKPCIPRQLLSELERLLGPKWHGHAPTPGA